MSKSVEDRSRVRIDSGFIGSPVTQDETDLNDYVDWFESVQTILDRRNLPLTFFLHALNDASAISHSNAGIDGIPCQA